MPKAKTVRAKTGPAERGDPGRNQGSAIDAGEPARLTQDLLFFAVRELNRAADPVLAETGWGRAHHRVLHFVGARPGLAVTSLLDILSITKQSLARVMTDLLDHDLVEQKTCNEDRRRRLLYLTGTGRKLERRLYRSQQEALVQAFAQAGPRSVEGFCQVLMALTGDDAQAYISDRIDAQATVSRRH